MDKQISNITPIKFSTYFILLTIYAITLSWFYYEIISPSYQYAEFYYKFDLGRILISIFIFAINVVSVPKNPTHVSGKILQLHFIIMIIPLIVYYTFSGKPLEFLIMVQVCFLLQVFLLKKIPLFKTQKIKDGIKLTNGLFIALTSITFLYLFTTQSIKLEAFNFAVIYELRADRNIYGIFNYLITWQFRIINPFIIVLSFYKRKYNLLLFGIFMQILIYTMYPNKEVLLSIILLAVALLIENRKKSFSFLFIIFILLGLSISYYTFKSHEDYTIVSIFHRLIYVPAFTKYEHYLFFQDNQKLFYSEGLIGLLLGLESPYTASSGFLIADGAWGNANTGYIAYAYSNAGFLGMIIMSLLVVIILRFIDSITKDDDKRIVFPLLIYSMIMINDVDFLTILLNGGVLLLILALSSYSFRQDLKTKK